MVNKLSIKNLSLEGKKALIRVDFNVPINKGTITNDARIRASLPTIEYVLQRGGSVILMSHLGRPEGKIDNELSLFPCAVRLSELLGKPVKMASDCIGPETERMAQDLKPGEILMLENLRFHKGEENPREEPSFAYSLAALGDVYVDDAFGTAHRVQASTVTLAHLFPGKAAAGLLLEKEIAYLGTHLVNPVRPFCAILGGAKISTKFRVIETLMKRADVLLIGGAMANTFFKAQQVAIGGSLYEPDYLPVAEQILDVGNQSRCTVILPVDLVIAEKADRDAERRVVTVQEGVPANYKAFDIGPKTVKLFIEKMQNAATVFWNGPLGVFECPPFDQGTRAIAVALSQLSAVTIVGGGDSLAAIENAGMVGQMSHVSTGGGASLEYIERGQLPGIEALSEAGEVIKQS
jgi:3-phosphoglycerate kinase